MKLPKNKVQLAEGKDCLYLTIEMVHPQWIINLLFGVLAAVFLFYIFLISYFNIFEVLGAGSLIVSSFWILILLWIGKVAFWHKSGKEEYILADLSFSYQRSYGIYTGKLTSIVDLTYDLDFVSTPTQEGEEEKGILLFYNRHPVTKIEEPIYESALEITEEEYNIICAHLHLLRNEYV